MLHFNWKKLLKRMLSLRLRFYILISCPKFKIKLVRKIASNIQEELEGKSAK